MTSSLLPTAQRIVDGPWQHASGAREACAGGPSAWAAFVETSAPLAPFVFGRLDHARCRDDAAMRFIGPVEVMVRLLPVWACEAFEEPRDGWVRAHAIAVATEPFEAQETRPFVEDAEPALDVALTCKARSWITAVVVETGSYAPGVALLARRGAYGVLERRVLELLAVEADAGEPQPRPSSIVPAFSTCFEPRSSTEVLPYELRRRGPGGP